MKSRRFIIIAATAVAALGGGAAIAATQDDKAKERENAILSDAAERLDVETEALRTALSEAQQAQLDQAVEDGDLAQEQADRIKEHIQESGHVLGFPGGPPHMLHGPGGPGGPPFFDDIAKELGISVEKLHEQLGSGKTLAQIAKANGKSMADVRTVAKAAIEKQLAEDVESGRITESQADEIREHLPEMLRHLGKGPRFRHVERAPTPGPGGFDGPPPMGPPPAMEGERQ